MKRLIFIITCLFSGLLAIPQNIDISGIANHYLAVTAVGIDRVTITDVPAEKSFFKPGDKVLLIQMAGTTMPALPGVLTNPSRYKQQWNSAGMYEILQVEQVTGTTVIFTDDITRSYIAGEKIQLVRLVEGDNVTVTGVVTPKAWDGNTGGIVAIIGMDSVILKAGIDVSAMGFRGGIVPDEDYTAGCRKDVSAFILDTLYFLPSQLGRSGNKGEGIITVTWPYKKGAGFAINGGGAGNGLYSGGAGGSNYKGGGDGGKQSTVCTETLTTAWGGYFCTDLYNNNKGVIMGGGGGTGVKSPGIDATNGGNGGGIVLIITGTLDVRNSSVISANGQSVIGSAQGSGGGGGGGGAVLLDVTNYSGNLAVNVRGGNGGSTTGCTGSGGGGSGGVFWNSGTSFNGMAVDTSRGDVNNTCILTIGTPGGNGVKLKKLLTPLTGFLFNSIRGVDTLCAGQTLPNPLKGSQPKGGNGSYTYQWEQSTDSLAWSIVLGTPALRTFVPPALNQTTFYRRIVNSFSSVTGDPIADTSRTLKIFVYPSISGNTISSPDTICYNSPAKMLNGTNPSGGSGVYQYQWQFSTNQSAWNNAGTNLNYSPGPLTESLYFRRLVNSTVHCTSNSNSIIVTVLPLITENDFVSHDTVICDQMGPGLLNAKTPKNGDGTYSYEWQYKTLSGSWTSIAGSNVKRYDPGNLTDTTYYRRIVFSGNDQACKDTTAFVNIKRINVLPAISGNVPTTDTSRYCAGEIPVRIKGALPSGGDGIYSYQWRIQTSGNWSDIAGASNQDYLPDQIVETNTRFSRMVISGTYNACHDTSAAVMLDVVPYISNNLSLPGQTICENGTPSQLNPAPASGGLGGFTYQWIQYQEAVPGWINAPGTSDQASYIPGELTDTTLFARKAFSDICSHISDTVKVTVYPSISNNKILGGSVQYACFDLSKSLAGSLPSHGNGSYFYVWEHSVNNADWSPVAFIPESDQKDCITPGLTSTQYFRRLVYSSPENRECADTASSVEVRINPLPTGDIVASVDTLCAGEAVQVQFSTAGAHPPFTVTIDGQIKSGITASPDSMTFIPLASKIYSMATIADDSGCVADPAGYSRQAGVVVYDVPSANAGNDGGICSNTITLHAIKSIAGSVGNWSSAGATFSDPSDDQSNVTVDQYGTNSFTWTETNWQCSDDDSVVVIFYEQPTAVDAGPDQELDFKYTTQLAALTPDIGSGKWTVINGAGTFVNDTLPEAVVSELDNTTTLKWTVHNGSCPEISDDISIVIKSLNIPKGFTPNGDLKNDLFDLGATNAENIKIKIYNSVGILVFESDAYQDVDLWDGKNMNGVELPEGTYFYIADVKIAGREKVFQFRSFVEILR